MPRMSFMTFSGSHALVAGLIERRGFPPIRQEKGEWMGHEGIFADAGRPRRGFFDSAALRSLRTRLIESRGIPP
jgi:hypothetical protein